MTWQEQQLFLVMWKFLGMWPRAKRTGSSFFRAPLFLYHFGSASIALTTSPKGPLDHILQICQCELLYDSFILTDLSVWCLSVTDLSQEWCRMCWSLKWYFKNELKLNAQGYIARYHFCSPSSLRQTNIH